MSTHSDAEIAEAIARNYYGTAAQVQRVTRFNNVVFRLQLPSGSRILKMAKDCDGSSVQKELMLIKLVGGRGIPVPVVEHADASGSVVGRPFFIMHNAGAQTVAAYVGRSDETARRLFHDMGATLARIHAVTFDRSGDIEPGGIVPRDPLVYLQKLGDFAESLIAERLLEPAEVSFFRQLELPALSGSELCHGDFHTVQCVVHSDRIAAVVDWESARSGTSAIDLAVTHGYLDYYVASPLIDRFFAGYTSERAIPQSYESVSIMARMALMLTLLRVWRGQGPRSWRYALEHRRIDRAIALYRGYTRQLDQ